MLIAKKNDTNTATINSDGLIKDIEIISEIRSWEPCWEDLKHTNNKQDKVTIANEEVAMCLRKSQKLKMLESWNEIKKCRSKGL